MNTVNTIKGLIDSVDDETVMVFLTEVKQEAERLGVRLTVEKIFRHRYPTDIFILKKKFLIFSATVLMVKAEVNKAIVYTVKSPELEDILKKTAERQGLSARSGDRREFPF